jgi:hypothetical protein
VSDLPKLLGVLVTPHTDAQVAAIGRLSFGAFSRRVQPSASYRGHNVKLFRLSLRLSVRRMDVTNVLMVWVIAVGTRGGNIDLRHLRGGFATSGLSRFDNHGEALTGRRRDAFGRTYFEVVKGFMSAVSLGAKEIHLGKGLGGRWRNVLPVNSRARMRDPRSYPAWCSVRMVVLFSVKGRIWSRCCRSEGHGRCAIDIDYCL